MPPIVLTALQVVLLLLLYLFVARAVRVIARELKGGFAAPAAPVAARPAPVAPARNAQPRELVVHVASDRPRVIALDSADITFGRAESSTVVLPDPFVSDAHARVYYADGAWYVADLGSTNGTYINQRRVVEPHVLSAGDQLGIGKTTVQVRR